MSKFILNVIQIRSKVSLYFRFVLEWGSIGSSPWNDIIFIEDMHLVLPALSLSFLNADILIMVNQVRLMMFLLKMVDYSMTVLSLSTWSYHCWVGWGGWMLWWPLCYMILESAHGPLAP